MKEETVKGWIRKAESDLKVGHDELGTDDPATDAVAFHSQQCAEKYLKAYLVYHGKEIRKTHDLTELIERCSEIDAEFHKLYALNVDRLTEYAVDMRYPQEFLFPSVEEARNALELAEQVKSFVLDKLRSAGLET